MHGALRSGGVRTGQASDGWNALWLIAYMVEGAPGIARKSQRGEAAVAQIDSNIPVRRRPVARTPACSFGGFVIHGTHTPDSQGPVHTLARPFLGARTSNTARTFPDSKCWLSINAHPALPPSSKEATYDGEFRRQGRSPRRLNGVTPRHSGPLLPDRLGQAGPTFTDLLRGHNGRGSLSGWCTVDGASHSCPACLSETLFSP